MMMMDGGDEESLLATAQRKKIRDNKNSSRRFSEEQIRSLESMFNLETKLEPRKKLQLATDLGLQPRQVAIWFQNRRARWKSKQIEHEYRLLKSNYDNLTSRFHSLNNEKQSFLIQLQKLRGKLENAENKDMDQGNAYSTTDESESQSGKKISELKENPNIYSDDDNNIKSTRYPAAQAEEEETELSEHADRVSLVPPERLCCNFEFGGLFDHSAGGTLNWWDFSI